MRQFRRACLEVKNRKEIVQSDYLGKNWFLRMIGFGKPNLGE